MWERIAGSFGWLFRFFFPERAAWAAIILGYKQALDDEKNNAEAREGELKTDIAALRRAEASCQKQLSAARKDITELQQRVWELTAVVHAIDAVKKLREDPEFQRTTVEQVRLLMQREAAGEDPAG